MSLTGKTVLRARRPVITSRMCLKYDHVSTRNFRYIRHLLRDPPRRVAIVIVSIMLRDEPKLSLDMTQLVLSAQIISTL